MRSARLASLSTGRWDLSFEGRLCVFQERGITWRGRQVHTLVCKSGALYLRRKRKVRKSQPAAGLTVGRCKSSSV